MKRFIIKEEVVVCKKIDCHLCSRYGCVYCEDSDCIQVLKVRLCAMEDAIEELENRLKMREQSLDASVNGYYREGIQDAMKILETVLEEYGMV